MKAISKYPLNCNFSTPIYARGISSVMGFSVDQDIGEQAILHGGWRRYRHSSSAYVSSCNQMIAWYYDDSWCLATRRKTLNFSTTAQRQVGWTLFGVRPDFTFVLPPTIVVPVCGSKASIAGRDVRCQRICPPRDAEPCTLNVLGHDVEFRICLTERNGIGHCYAELNFGFPRQNALGEPRRALYLSDYRHYHRDATRYETVAARAVMQLRKFILTAGYELDAQAKRPDLVPLGEYNLLPNTKFPYALLNRAGPNSAKLLAFAGFPYEHEVLPSERVENIIAELDGTPSDGPTIHWVSGAVRRRARRFA